MALRIASRRFKPQWLPVAHKQRCFVAARSLTSASSPYRQAQTPTTGRFTPVAQDAQIVRSIYPNVDIPHGNVPLHSLIFDNLAPEDAKRLAIRDGVTGLAKTFGQLQEETTKFGSYLARGGLERHGVVGIHLPNCPDYAVAFLGTGAAGGTVTTINSVYTEMELTRQLQDSQAKVLVTSSDTLETATASARQVGMTSILAVGITTSTTVNDVKVIPFDTYLEDDGSALPSYKFDNDNDIAVLPFSSGTTGLPKGVELTHRNIIANIKQIAASPELVCFTRRPKETILCILPFFHIYGMVVLLLSGLYQRAKLVTLPKFEPASFLATASKEKVSQLFVAPPLAVFLAKHPLVAEYDLSSIYAVFSGAAPLGGNITEEVSKRLNGCNVLQGYGLTELSPVCHVTPFSGPRHGSVGMAIPNTEVSIIDVKGNNEARLLGTGLTGEICVRGPQVMHGYLNQPEATAAMLDNEGWLHTGDIGHHDEDGYLYITDRLKELIKRKGFQVAPAELERVLLTHPMIVDAAVIGVPDEREGELPRAYVVRREGSQLSEDDVADFMSERLSPHKRPDGGVVFTDSIPKSASGKILRRELRAQSL